MSRRGTPIFSIHVWALLAAALASIAVAGCGAQSDASSADGMAHLRFEQRRAMPASTRVDVPGSKEFEMGLLEGQVEATGANAAGLTLVRVSTTLKIDAGAPAAKGRILCSVQARKGARIAQTVGGLSATYPRPSEEGIYGQPAPATLLIRFPSRGEGLAELEVGDRPERFTTVRGVKLEWPEYEPGTERLRYFLPQDTSKGAIELPFFTIWQARKPSPFKIACTLATAAGTSTVETEGSHGAARAPVRARPASRGPRAVRSRPPARRGRRS